MKIAIQPKFFVVRKQIVIRIVEMLVSIPVAIILMIKRSRSRDVL